MTCPRVRESKEKRDADKTRYLEHTRVSTFFYVRKDLGEEVTCLCWDGETAVIGGGRGTLQVGICSSIVCRVFIFIQIRSRNSREAPGLVPIYAFLCKRGGGGLGYCFFCARRNFHFSSFHLVLSERKGE